MDENIQIYYGNGKGKSSAALGLCIKEASIGKSVMVVQFLKGNNQDRLEFLRKLEPEIRIFSFEQTATCFTDLPKQLQEDQLVNIRNGWNFVRKVVRTGECDILVIDEILGVIDIGIITLEEFKEMLEEKEEGVQLILTGSCLPSGMAEFAEHIYCISMVK
ncbi:MAG: cob(I)yrinic acid a,c-diamide adenosyltransferase [Lachnospiraceae bacterium]